MYIIYMYTYLDRANLWHTVQTLAHQVENVCYSCVQVRVRARATVNHSAWEQICVFARGGPGARCASVPR